MKTKKIKRSIALMLIVLILTQFNMFYSNAGTEKVISSANFELSDVNKGSEEQSILTVLGITELGKITDVKEIDLGNSISKVFSVQFGSELENRKNTIKVSIGSERILLDITEGGIHDSLEIMRTGEVFLNGKLAMRCEDMYLSEIFGKTVGGKKGGMSVYYQQSAPYGNAASYSYYYRNEKKADIALGKRVSDLATGTLISIIGLACFFSVAAGGFIAIVGGVVGWFQSSAPASTHLSYNANVYTHSSYHSGYIPAIFTRVYKYQGKWYAGKNYTGSYTSRVFYKCELVG